MNGVSGSMQHVTWNAATELVADAPRFETLNLSPKSATDGEGRRENRWSGKDVLQFLCFEMGSEKNHGGILKTKTIDPLLTVLSDAKLGNAEHKSAAVLQGSTFNSQVSMRRQRKGCKPSRLPPTIERAADEDEKKPGPFNSCSPHSQWVCRNSTCKAQMPAEVSFCKECSCYICKRYDDNRDPNLWISCSSESAAGTFGCGSSCHVECALKRRIAGVIGAGSNMTLDGSYCCQICGRISSLIGYCKKQLVIAKDSGRVDVLCHRLCLSHRLLNGTHLYKNIHETINEAIQRLEGELGSTMKGSVKFGNGVVNTLSCNAEVLKLVTSAIEKMDASTVSSEARAKESKPQEAHTAACAMHFEDVSSSSIVVSVDDDISGSNQKPVGYNLWHRKACESSYPCNPTCFISSTTKKALVSNLEALTPYAFKIVSFSSEGDERQCEAECSTKGIEVTQIPMALHSLDLVSSPNKTQERKSDCLNEQIEINHSSDECVPRCGIHDFEKDLLDQQLLVVNGGLSQCLPSASIVQKKRRINLEKAQHFSPPSGVNLNTRTDVSTVYWEGTKSKQTACSGPSSAHKNNDPWARNCKRDVQMRIPVPDVPGKGRIKQDLCMSVGNRVGKPFGECRPYASETRGRKETVTILGSMGCLNGYGEFCPNDGNALVSKSDYPCQSWAVQVQSRKTGIGTKSQSGLEGKRAVCGVDSFQNHLHGVISQKVDSDANSLEFFVRVIRWLEFEGHLNKNLRIKFLTWYSLRATEHEKRVVSVFIDTLQDDPASLAGQLVDAFEDVIDTKRQQLTVDGYSNRLAPNRNG